MLEKWNHFIILADSGKLGLEIFFNSIKQGKKVDLVITDLEMPYMDGKSVAESIKSRYPETLVILMTGWGAFIESNSIKSVDYILRKLITIDELYDALITVLKISKSRKNNVIRNDKKYLLVFGYLKEEITIRYSYKYVGLIKIYNVMFNENLVNL